jgi:hypothetical protein
VVAQWFSPLADTKLPRSSSGFDPCFLYSLLRGGRNYDCVILNKSQDVRRPFMSKKQNKNRKQMRKRAIRTEGNTITIKKVGLQEITLFCLRFS